MHVSDKPSARALRFERSVQTATFHSPLEDFASVDVEVEVRTDPLTGRRARVVPESFLLAEDPDIEADQFRKYIAYVKRNVFPSMIDEAREAIREFYVDLRAHVTEEGEPVPITARKLEALVRLAKASARVRLSDTVEVEDAPRRAIGRPL